MKLQPLDYCIGTLASIALIGVFGTLFCAFVVSSAVLGKVFAGAFLVGLCGMLPVVVWTCLQ